MRRISLRPACPTLLQPAPTAATFLVSYTSARAVGTAERWPLGGRKMAVMWNHKNVLVLCFVLASAAAVHASTPEVIWQFDTAG